MSLHTRNANVNVENALGGLRGKPVTTSSFGLKRSALGEIGNKVLLTRSNTHVGGKPGALIKPKTEINKPLARSASVTVKSTATAVPQTTTFAKPLARPNVTSRVKRTDSVTSVILPPPRSEEEIKTSSAYSNKFEQQQVFNVDKEDEDNPLLVGYYAYDIYEYLRSMESKFVIKEDFLAGQEVTPRMRATLVDWLVEVQQQYHLLQETLYLTIQILDRYLQAVPTVTRKFLQLVGVTAMYVACKYEEIYSPEISDFVYITDKAYTKQQVLSMELQIVRALDFQFCRPVSLTFLRRYSKVVEAMPIHHCFSKYFLELALMEYTFSHVNPSLVAAASLYVALCINELKGKKGPLHWDAKMEYYSTYNVDKVEAVAKKLAAIILKSPSSKFEAVRKKYASSKMMKVSLRPELEEECLNRLAEGLSPFP